MPDTPNYGFNKKPRFSTNHLADYLCATTAPQRTAVIRDAKFPRKPAVTAYSQIKPTVCQFLGSNSGDLAHFDVTLKKLAAKAERETGYNRDEALRCQAAINAFKEAFTKTRAKKYEFSAGPADIFMKLEGVHVSIRLDARVMETQDDGATYAGGCILFLAGSADARKRIEDRRKYVAATIHWGLEGSGQMEPLPRLCMSFDVFGKAMEKAPASYDRLRKNMQHSCAEVARAWDGVEPPSGYDGPDWK